MQEEKLIRVLVVEDHAVVREGLCSLLTARYGVQVIGEAADGIEAVEKARALQPDVILMDLVMPRMTGLEAILKIREEDPDARILVLTSSAEEAKVSAVIKAGAMGYLLKDSSADDLALAIQNVHRGNVSLPQELIQKMMSGLWGDSDDAPPKEELTRRELDVLKCVAQGMSNAEIAEALTVSLPTVHSHVHNLLGKLNMTSRTQAALYAVEIG
ncbi:MAG: response regulator, partial [Anaerolineae bacterium]|nr:response regulator [Anaerolineae bacterium]